MGGDTETPGLIQSTVKGEDEYIFHIQENLWQVVSHIISVMYNYCSIFML